MEYLIKQYPLESGALEIQYIEEYFGEFPRRKTAARDHRPPGRSRVAHPDGRGAAARRPWHAGAGVLQDRPRDPRHARADAEAARPGGAPARLRRRSKAAASSIRGLAAPGATGAARATSARSPRNRSRGRSPRASTRSSSRRRTVTTTCAPCSPSSSSTSSSSSGTTDGQRRVEGLPGQAAARGTGRAITAACAPSCRPTRQETGDRK